MGGRQQAGPGPTLDPRGCASARPGLSRAADRFSNQVGDPGDQGIGGIGICSHASVS